MILLEVSCLQNIHLPPAQYAFFHLSNSYFCAYGTFGPGTSAWKSGIFTSSLIEICNGTTQSLSSKDKSGLIFQILHLNLLTVSS